MHVKIRVSFWLYLSFIALLTSMWACMGMLCALLVHEAAHAVVCHLLREPISSVELTPFGGIMTYIPGKSSSKGIRGILIAAAGPLGNYLLILLIAHLGTRLPEQFLREVILANTAMLIINLIPVLPLDGGRIVFSAGYYVFGVSALICVLTALGILFGLMLILLGVYLAAVYGTMNVTILLVGGYIAVCAAGSRSTMLSENLYTVVQERLSSQCGTRRVQLYAVPSDIRLCALLQYIARVPSALFIVTKDTQQWLIYEEAVLRGLLNAPYACIDTLIHKEGDG